MTQRRKVGSKINKRKINKLETTRKDMQKSSLVRVDKIKHYGVRQVLATTWTRIVWPGSMISGQQQFFRPQELVGGTTAADALLLDLLLVWQQLREIARKSRIVEKEGNIGRY